MGTTMTEVFEVVEITGNRDYPTRDWKTCASHAEALKYVSEIKADNPHRPRLVFRIEPRYVVEMPRAEAKAKLRELEMRRLREAPTQSEREFQEVVKEVLRERIAKQKKSSPQKDAQ